jgi:nicotinamide mononucleotide transporter
VAATEAIAVALGFAYVVLAILQRRECWIAGGASTALYVVVFDRAGLSMQAALQLLYVALAVYGWWQWRPGGALPAAPRSWPLARHVMVLAAVGGVSVINAALAERFALSAAPLADSLGAWASVAATWLLARRVIESWLWWIVVDLGLAVLFANSGLYPTAVLYLAFAALAVVGWRTWRRAMPRDDARIAAIVVELGLARPDVKPLDGGPVNQAFRLKDATNDFVLRLAGGVARSLGADHESEQAVQSLAAAHGLAPAVVIARPGEGILVTGHVVGRRLEHADLHDAAILERIGGWLARLHALEPPARPAVDFGARAAGYLERLHAHRPEPQIALLAEQLAAQRAALSPPGRLATCHHDLHHRNWLETEGRLIAIDWEYAGPGDPAADLAACIGYHDLAPAEVAALLAGYGESGRELRARVEALAWIFTCLWFGWNAVAGLHGIAIDRTEQRRLLARLVP